IIRFVRAASWPPFRSTALEERRQSAAASAVTFGRDSKIIRITPIGTRTRLQVMPEGALRSSKTFPTGSGCAEIACRPLTISSTRFSSSFRRSSLASLSRSAFAWSTSALLASRMSGSRDFSRAPIAAIAADFAPAVARRSCTEAAFARLACSSAGLMSHQHRKSHRNEGMEYYRKNPLPGKCLGNKDDEVVPVDDLVRGPVAQDLLDLVGLPTHDAPQVGRGIVHEPLGDRRAGRVADLHGIPHVEGAVAGRDADREQALAVLP